MLNSSVKMPQKNISKISDDNYKNLISDKHFNNIIRYIFCSRSQINSIYNEVLIQLNVKSLQMKSDYFDVSGIFGIISALLPKRLWGLVQYRKTYLFCVSLLVCLLVCLLHDNCFKKHPIILLIFLVYWRNSRI